MDEGGTKAIHPICEGRALRVENTRDSEHPNGQHEVNYNSVGKEPSHFEIKGFIVCLWDFAVSDKDVLEVHIPKPKPEEGSNSDDGHSSRKTETHKDKHNGIGIVILNLKLHGLHSLLHLRLNLHALCLPVTIGLLNVMSQRHGEIGMHDHNDPSKENLITNSSVPFRYEIAVLIERVNIAGHVGVANEERHKGLERNTADIGL